MRRACVRARMMAARTKERISSGRRSRVFQERVSSRRRSRVFPTSPIIQRTLRSPKDPLGSRNLCYALRGASGSVLPGHSCTMTKVKMLSFVTPVSRLSS